VIAVLCGGVGGSRFLQALTTVIRPARVTAIINTGDDDWFHGLYVSPDPDIITYTLAGEVDEERGWGLRGDTYRWLESIARLGHETWFRIGDRDLATHVHRTRLLREGRTLSEIVNDVRTAFGVAVRLLPMSDDRMQTMVETDDGELRFQEYLVKRKAQDPVRGVRYDGAPEARAAPGVLEALGSAEAICIAPSNPIGSIGPILAIPEIREAIAGARVPRIAISPIIGGRSLQPPAGEMMEGLGYRVDVRGVADVYSGLIDTLILDEADAALARTAEETGVTAIVARTLLRGDDARRELGSAALHAVGITGQ
jgi:LPPG:FO 2-phospho-L-lactate transferase